jgi:adenylyltransferase/sulfurtransferase
MGNTWKWSNHRFCVESNGNTMCPGWVLHQRPTCGYYKYRDRKENEMAVKVIIPAPLRQYTGKRDSIEITAKTVGEALAGLTSQYSDLRRHLFTDDGKLRSFVNVYLNEEDVRFLEKDQTPLRENDVISIVPSIAGGMSLRCICS